MGNQVVTDLVTNNAGLNTGLSSGERAIRGFAGRVTGIMKNVGGALAGFFAVRTIGSFLGSSIREFEEADKTARKLEAVLKATGHAAGFSSDQLKQHASALQEVTTYGDDAIINAQALLATFKQIRGDVFTDATEAILDMSAAMDTDLKSSAIQVGKALNDPVAGISALTRVGVTFTQKQKDTIQSLVASNRVMDAQKIILEELKSEFGGVAREMAKGSGARKQLANDWSDLKEDVGKLTFELTDGAIPGLRGFIRETRETIPMVGDAAKSIRDWTLDWIDFNGQLGEATKGLNDFQAASMAIGGGVMDAFDPFGFDETQAKAREQAIESAKTLRRALQELADDMAAIEGGASPESLGYEAGTTIESLRQRAKDAIAAAEARMAEANAAHKNTSDYIAEEFRRMNQERAKADGRPMPGDFAPPEADINAPKDKANKGGGDNAGARGGSRFESIESLFKRIQGATADNPQVKAVKDVKAAVDAAAKDIVGAIKGGGAAAGPGGEDPAPFRGGDPRGIIRRLNKPDVAAIMANRAAEERRRQLSRDERGRGETDGLVDEGGHKQALSDNEHRQMNAAAQRRQRMLENQQRVAAAREEAEQKRRERMLRSALSGNPMMGEGGGAQAIEGAGRGYRTVRPGDATPTIIGSGATAFEGYSRHMEGVQSRLPTVGPKPKDAKEAAKEQVDATKGLGSKLDTLIAETQATNNQLQTVNAQLPKVGGLK